MITIKSCVRCRFFDDYTSSLDEYKGEHIGACHRFPPTRTDHRTAGSQPNEDEESQAGSFAIVFAGDWCGEYKPKDKAPVLDANSGFAPWTPSS